MKIQSTLLLLAVFLFAQAARAQDDFRVIIAKGDGEPKLSDEQIAQFKKAGVASPDELPIVVCPLGGQNKTQTNQSNTFQLLIENLRDKEMNLTMLNSGWYNSIEFKLVDDHGASYTIMRSVNSWSKNGPETRTWPAHGSRKLPISFLESHGSRPAWRSSAGDPGHPKDLWPSPAGPVLGRLTAFFSYLNQNRKSITVTSKPTDVILMAK